MLNEERIWRNNTVEIISDHTFGLVDVGWEQACFGAVATAQEARHDETASQALTDDAENHGCTYRQDFVIEAENIVPW